MAEGRGREGVDAAALELIRRPMRPMKEGCVRSGTEREDSVEDVEAVVGGTDAFDDDAEEDVDDAEGCKVEENEKGEEDVERDSGVRLI